MFTLDTNAIIYYLKDDARAVSFFHRILVNEDKIYISSITEIELLGFSNLSEKEITLIESFIDSVSVIALDSRIARLAAYLRRNYRTKLPDSVIAATALYTGSTLVTRNTGDFKKIPNLSIQKI